MIPQETLRYRSNAFHPLTIGHRRIGAAVGFESRGKMTPINSIPPERVLADVGANSLAGYTGNGENVWFGNDETTLWMKDGAARVPIGTGFRTSQGSVLTSYQTEIVRGKGIIGVYAEPFSKYGELHLMHLYLGLDRNGEAFAPALVDLPEPLLAQTIHDQSGILLELKKRAKGGPVNWAEHYWCGLEGPGFQSVKFPHQHMWWFGDDVQDPSLAEIQSARDEMPWDGGLSRRLGTQVANDVEPTVQAYWPRAKLHADAMGMVIDLPGFGPEQMADINWINYILRPVCHTTHAQLRRWHNNVFTSELDQLVSFVRDGHRRGSVDMQQWEQFFVRRYDKGKTPQWVDEDTKQLNELEDAELLRHPVGWGTAIEFTTDEETGENHALLATIVGAMNFSMGGVEALARDFDPEPVRVPCEEVGHKGMVYRRVMTRAVTSSHRQIPPS